MWRAAMVECTCYSAHVESSYGKEKSTHMGSSHGRMILLPLSHVRIKGNQLTGSSNLSTFHMSGEMLPPPTHVGSSHVE